VNYKDVRKEESSVPAGGSFSEEGSRGDAENEGGRARHERTGSVLRCEGWLLGALQGCTEICLPSTSSELCSRRRPARCITPGPCAVELT
jgi:hypothetical protein